MQRLKAISIVVQVRSRKNDIRYIQTVYTTEGPHTSRYHGKKIDVIHVIVDRFTVTVTYIESRSKHVIGVGECGKELDMVYRHKDRVSGCVA